MKGGELKDAINKIFKEIQKRGDKRTPSLTPEKIQKAISEELPIQGQDIELLLSQVGNRILPFINPNTKPEYAAYITGSGDSISVLAEFIKAYYNQNALKWNSSPIASELEKLVLKWTAEFLEAPQFSEGMLTGSGSMSNFLAIHFALAVHFPEREELGLPKDQKPIVYCSEEAHSSIERAMVFTGLGRNNLRKIPVNDRFQIDIRKLSLMIEDDLMFGEKPFMLIGTAGTTNLGVVDDLEGLADQAEKYGLWYHVDGAYGLPAARCPEVSSLFKGFKRADSLTINQHKWMYVNFEASSILFRKMPKAITFSPAYLLEDDPDRWESSSQTIDLSKEFSALKIWFTFKYLGAQKIESYIRHDIFLTDYFAEKLSEFEFICVFDHHPLSILCFRAAFEELNAQQNDQLTIDTVKRIEEEGKIFLTGTKLHSRPYIRAYFGNPQRTKKDVEFMTDVIRESFQVEFSKMKW